MSSAPALDAVERAGIRRAVALDELLVAQPDLMALEAEIRVRHASDAPVFFERARVSIDREGDVEIRALARDHVLRFRRAWLQSAGRLAGLGSEGASRPGCPGPLQDDSGPAPSRDRPLSTPTLDREGTERCVPPE